MAFDAPNPSHPFAILSRSVRLGRPFGIEVRVYVTAIFVVLVGVHEFSAWQGVSFPTALALSLASAFALYLVVLTHEFGHAWAAARHGVRTPTITLSAFGGLAHMSTGAPGPRAEILIALAGPLTHLFWIALAWPLARVVPPLEIGEFGLRFDAAAWFWRMNAALLLFNLLPAFPMDGGRALRAALATRMHPNRATLIACRIGIVAAIGIAVWGIDRSGFERGLLLVIALNNGLACVAAMRAARHTEGPYEPVDRWAGDGEEWKRGPAAVRHAEIATEVLGLPLHRSLARAARRTADEEVELDRLLDRVSAVGIAGLAPDERQRLTELSAGPRGRG